MLIVYMDLVATHFHLRPRSRITICLLRVELYVLVDIFEGRLVVHVRKSFLSSNHPCIL
jgi:hypothetical protein